MLLDTTRGRLGLRLPDPGDRADGRLDAAAGTCRAQAACRSSGAIDSCRTGAAEYAQADHPYRRRRISNSSTRDPGAAPWVEPHPLLQLSGLSEPRSDLGRHPGDQHRRGARRARRRERAVRRGLRADLAAACVGWSNPELRGDEYVLDEDVEQVPRRSAGGREDMSDGNRCDGYAGRHRRRTRRSPSCAASGRMWCKHLQGSDDVDLRARRTTAG